MEIKCQKCGELADDDQAFCSKCGAVLGMGDAGEPRGESPPNLAATVVGKFPLTPPSKPPASQPPPQKPAASQPPQQPSQSRGAQAPAAPPPVQAPARQTPPPQPPPQQQAFPPSLTTPPPSRGGSTWLLVIVGFVAVLLVGALLIYLFIFNLRQ